MKPLVQQEREVQNKLDKLLLNVKIGSYEKLKIINILIYALGSAFLSGVTDRNDSKRRNKPYNKVNKLLKYNVLNARVKIKKLHKKVPKKKIFEITKEFIISGYQRGLITQRSLDDCLQYIIKIRKVREALI